MNRVKKIRDKIGEEKFVWRVIVGGCTFLSTVVLMTTEAPRSLVWMMGMLNGFLLIEQLNNEFEEDDGGED